MSFDYLDDIFGKFREGRTTRFTAIEKKAIELLISFVQGSMYDKDFASAFDEVRKEFIKLTEVNGQITIDEDTPLWLNSLLGLHFIKWCQFQQVKWYFEEHPDKLVGDSLRQFERIQRMGIDEQFKETCRKTLAELS